MAGLFRLKNTSNLIDKGTVVAIDTISLPYFGILPDVGAFEYNPSTAVEKITIDDAIVSVYYSDANKELVIVGEEVAAVDVFDSTGKKLLSQHSNTENRRISTKTPLKEFV